MLRAGLWHRGIQKQIIADTPQAGQDWFVQVPNAPEGVWYEVLAIVAQLVTSAAVATRQVRWMYFTSPNEIGQRLASAYVVCSTPGNLLAGTSRIFAAGAGCPAVNNASDLTGLPIGVRVPAGHFIGSLTSAMDVADQWKLCLVHVQEWVYEPAAERTPNIGDGSGRVDTVSFDQFNKTMQRLALLLESQQATV